MSDEVAKQREQEEEDARNKSKKAEEEAKKRLWVVSLILDPATGTFAVQPNENIKKQWQLNTMIEQARKQLDLTANAKIVGEMIVNILKTEGVIKSKKGLFRGR